MPTAVASVPACSLLARETWAVSQSVQHFALAHTLCPWQVDELACRTWLEQCGREHGHVSRQPATAAALEKIELHVEKKAVCWGGFADGIRDAGTHACWVLRERLLRQLAARSSRGRRCICRFTQDPPAAAASLVGTALGLDGLCCAPPGLPSAHEHANRMCAQAIHPPQAPVAQVTKRLLPVAVFLGLAAELSRLSRSAIVRVTSPHSTGRWCRAVQPLIRACCRHRSSADHHFCWPRHNLTLHPRHRRHSLTLELQSRHIYWHRRQRSCIIRRTHLLALFCFPRARLPAPLPLSLYRRWSIVPPLLRLPLLWRVAWADSAAFPSRRWRLLRTRRTRWRTQFCSPRCSSGSEVCLALMTLRATWC